MTSIDFSDLCIKPEDVTKLVYHGGCNDGFGAALCGWLYATETGRDIKFVAGYFNSKIPDFKDDNVVIFDFSYKFEIFMNMITNAHKIAIIDHHKTALKDLETVPNKNKLIRIDHSGAYLAWQYFFPNRPVPKLIQYIEDIDLWNFQLPNAKYFNAWFKTVEQIFPEYAKCLDDDYLLKMILEKGIPMYELNMCYINSTVTRAAIKFITFDNERYYMVAYANTSILKSEIGNELIEKYKDIDFSVPYSILDSEDATLFSLRSSNSRTDVSEIAEMFGSGGHHNASAHKLDRISSTLPSTTLDVNNIYWQLQYIKIKKLEMETNTCHVVYTDISTNKLAVSKYLLQMRNSDVQQCISIYKNANGEEIKDKVEMAVVYKYDELVDKTYYTIYVDPLTDTALKYCIHKYLNINGEYSDVYRISRTGRNLYL